MTDDEPAAHADAVQTHATHPNHGGGPRVSTEDPIEPATQTVGGTYAPADYSLAARRSAFRTNQETVQGTRDNAVSRGVVETPEERTGPCSPELA
jgi:hypothetical protein